MDPDAAGAAAPHASAAVLGLPAGTMGGGDSGLTSEALPPDLPGIKHRASVACRRCRRMRTKCIHEGADPPCKACREAGLGPAGCIFPMRGQPDLDRVYRHPRVRVAKPHRRDPTQASQETASRTTASTTGPAKLDQNGFPPAEEVLDGVQRFITQYFQLGFFPKQRFLKQVRQDYRSVSVFMLLGILSISARLSPALRARYGGVDEASSYFMDLAMDAAVREVYETPTLERCQAFYLLGVAQQGSGDLNKSSINMGISMRMAMLMRLHREETFRIANPIPRTILWAESARRTLFMLHCQDSLHSGPLSPATLAAADITTLLPSSEDDFDAGRQPESRAALQDSRPGQDQHLIHDPRRSLFASVLQAHQFWAMVSRSAIGRLHSPSPWDRTSEFSRMAKRLEVWEQELPPAHVWRPILVKSYKERDEETGYLCLAMMTRLCNIILRRPILKHNPARPQFVSELSLALFHNVRALYDLIDVQFANRDPDCAVGIQIASLCFYTCGLFSAYLCKYPSICPDHSIVAAGETMLERTIVALTEYREVWHLASRWAEQLKRYANDPHSATLFGTQAGSDPVGTMPYSATISTPSPQHPTPQHITTSPTYSEYQTPQNLPALGMPIKALHAPQSQHQQQQHLQQNTHIPYQTYSISSAPQQQQQLLQPATDGFEDELQFFIEGRPPWPETGRTSWLV